MEEKIKTDRSLKALKPKDEDYHRLIDGANGLRIVVYTTGSKSFVYRYTVTKLVDGEKKNYKKEYTIGKYAGKSIKRDPEQKLEDFLEYTLSEARRMHQRLVGMRKAGKDPQIERLKEKTKIETNPTLKDYSIEHIKGKKIASNTFRLYTSVLEVNVFPVLGGLQIKDITTQMVVKLLKEVRKKKPSSATKVLGLLKEIFREARINKLVDSNPVIELTRLDHAGGSNNTRERFLSFDEIKPFLIELETAPASLQTKSALKVALFTGKRISEILTVERHEVDTEKRLWTIPWNKRKQTGIVKKYKRPDKIYLTDSMVEIFKELLDLIESSFLFAHHITDFKKPITRHAVKDFLSHWSDTFGIDKFSVHDLRRTFATNARKAGISYDGREACLAHEKTGTDRNYDLDDYWDEKIKSWQLWESKIISIMNSEKVISLDERRA